MPRVNETRGHETAQKKGVQVSVIPFTAAETIGDGTTTGSVYVQLPERVLIQQVTLNVVVAAVTVGATADIIANGLILVDEMPLTVSGISGLTLIANARYMVTGGELVIRPGAVTPIVPADAVMVAEIVVEYVELDKNSGEYTRHLSA